MNYRKLLTVIDKKYMNDSRAAAVHKKYQSLDNFRTAFSSTLKIYGFVLWLMSLFIAIQVSGVSAAVATALLIGPAQVYWGLFLVIGGAASGTLHIFFVKAYPAALIVLLVLACIYFLITIFYVSRILSSVINLEDKN